MKFNCLEAKKIGILGFGVTGKEVYECLKDDHQLVIINDELVAGYEVYSPEEVPDLDVIIKSPGISYDHPLLKSTKAIITNDIELSYLWIKQQKLPTKIIAITGTNGKTTTTQFISDVLNLTYTAAPCGNIGTSPLTILNNNNVDFLVMELSSYQLKQVDKFTPDYSLFLNISPDHLDYHHTFDDYLQSKCKLFANQSFQPLVILNEVVTKYKLKLPESSTFGVDEVIKDQISSSTIPWVNLKLIIDLLLHIGIDLETIIKCANNFKGLPHRLELLENTKDVKVINDSKATNVNATNAGIATMTTPTILLVGGSVKQEDYRLLDSDNEHIIQVVSYGQAASKFAHIKEIVSFEDFQSSVKYCLEQIKPGQTLLFSPSCASFDQHKNYVERGLQFKNIVKEFYE